MPNGKLIQSIVAMTQMISECPNFLPRDPRRERVGIIPESCSCFRQTLKTSLYGVHTQLIRKERFMGHTGCVALDALNIVRNIAKVPLRTLRRHGHDLARFRAEGKVCVPALGGDPRVD